MERCKQPVGKFWGICLYRRGQRQAREESMGSLCLTAEV